MKAIERIYKYLDFKGFKAVPFEKKIGLSNGYLGKQLSRNADLGEGIIIKIIENCPDLNPLWIITGDGSMLKAETPNNIVNEPIETYGIRKTNKGIPFIPEKTLASHNTFDVSVMNSDIELYFNIPVLKEKADFVCQLKGDSMSPTFENDDYIVCKIIEKSEFKWETPYFISVNHAPMLKRLLPSVTKGNLLCRSDNNKYRDFEVKESDITAIAKIIFPKRH